MTSEHNPHNPQTEQMGDESMVRNLAHQIEAIWPQERPLFDRYNLSGPLQVLDLGCGTGEMSRRLASRYSQATVLGIDIMEQNLAIARRENVGWGDRIRYEHGDAFALNQAHASFDLVVCRHLSQAVPDFRRVVVEMTRVLKAGGWLHVLSEDYGMLHMPSAGDPRLEPDRFWREVAMGFLDSIGCDGRIGRHTPPLLEELGYRDVTMDFMTVDTLRVPRATFAGIITAWRDGYSEGLARATKRRLEDVTAAFDGMIASIQTPPRYAVWHVPVIAGRKPDRG